MSEYSLFSQPEKPSTPDHDEKRGLLGLMVFFVVLLAGGAGGYIWWQRVGGLKGLTTPKPPPKVANDFSYETHRIRMDILAYLAQPRFAGRQFEEQVLGKAHLELFQIDDQEAYFSLPDEASQPAALQTVLQQLTLDPKKIDLAKAEDGRWKLGSYSLAQTPQKAVFFKTAAKNVKIEPHRILQFPFKQGTYTMNLKEMADFVSNKSIFGGLLRADTKIRDAAGKYVFFFNHGAYVAQPKEASLARLVGDLTKDIPASDPQAREKRIQRLLDLVTGEIEYDESEALSGLETLKRPNETLMSRRSDCSNKTILLGSLLEQLGEDYLFLYCPGHITVCVPQGGFPVTNGLTFSWEAKTWVIAETTTRGFEIGVTRVQDPEARFKRVQYVQRPRFKNIIYNANTFETLNFR
ncbi:MAG: hypothetical protein K1Y36_10020 [Blastocatellia bacterium]|nr:hypothetical protein [Blastocatellia bacterium]